MVRRREARALDAAPLNDGKADVNHRLGNVAAFCAVNNKLRGMPANRLPVYTHRRQCRVQVGGKLEIPKAHDSELRRSGRLMVRRAIPSTTV